MRQSLLAIAVLLAATIGVGAHPTGVAAAAAEPKVVIIVGSVGGGTDQYRGYGEQAYQEALKYTSNVVKVFSPNATWAAVVAATKGASIVYYTGHGNGWPSPYTYDPNYRTKDGFGLNAAAGQGDDNLKYYGEPSVATLDLAPNAVIFLNHLCYASGNSEPGHPAPTLDVAKQRADNYGTGFLKAGAAAVIAEGHGGFGPYIEALFSTHSTLKDLWLNASDAHGNDFSFASTRTAGSTVIMDPETPSGGYYRAISGRLSATTDQVTGAPLARTDVDPDHFVVPGAASVDDGGAEVYATADLSGDPIATLDAGDALRVDSTDQTGTDDYGSWWSPAVLGVHSLDGSVEGFVASNQLTPRDSAAPWVDGFQATPASFVSGINGPFDLTVAFTETASWRARLVAVDGGAVAFDQTGSGEGLHAAWNGTIGGVVAAPGRYRWTVTASDEWGNISTPTSATIFFWGDQGATYFPLTPARILDTRSSTGLAGTFKTGTPRTFAVAGHGGVPADAVAVTGNLTVTAQSAAGYVTLGPKPNANPTTSTLNFPKGDNRANGVIIALGSDGSLSAVYKGAGSTHLVFDVTGYFLANDEGARYRPVEPARILDTRSGNGLAGSFKTQVPRTFQVSGRGGIPANATAVAVNLTVTGQTSAGFISLTPKPTASPKTSTLNFPLGDNRANGAIVPLDANGKLSAVYMGNAAGSAAHLILDVSGYFLDDPSGATYVPIEPARLLDTRVGKGLSGAFTNSLPRSFEVGGHGGVPDGAIAASGNVTVVGQTVGGFVSLTPTPTADPATSTINFPVGDVRANVVAVPLGGGAQGAVFKASGAATTHLIFDATGYFLAPG